MTTMNGTKTSRPTLSNQIDRLDLILDGLSDALNESVADAVRDAVAGTVRDSVEAAVKEVLDDPRLLHEALERHGLNAPQPPTPQRRSLSQTLGRTLAWVCALAGGKASDAAKALSLGWNLALAKVRAAAQAAWGAARLAASALPGTVSLAWKYKGACAAALGVGAAVGAAAYLAGPMISCTLCGLAGAATSLVGSLLGGLFRQLGGR